MEKKWIKDGKIWDEKTSIVVGGQRVWNPTEEQLLAAGYTEYIAPVPTPEQLLEQAKQDKVFEIERYNESPAVNSFTISGQQMWLTVEERQQIATQISANEAAGREAMTRWFGGLPFEFPLATWKQMLVALEVYADDAINVTESHKAAVAQLETIEEVEAYDITADYPAKPMF
jgi:hypothetical protein